MSFEFKPDKKKETLNKTIRFPKELVDRIEKQVKKLEKKISMLEGNFPQPYNPNFSGMSNNYSI